MATFSPQNVYRIRGIGAMPTGIVKHGTLACGMHATIEGTDIAILRMERGSEEVVEAREGDVVALSLKVTERPMKKTLLRKLIDAIHRDPAHDLFKRRIGREIEFS